jgi:hypothetical protein
MTTYDEAGKIRYDDITASGTYSIAATGAQGGNRGVGVGGLGAAVSGDIYLAAGTPLEIVAGSEGAAPGGGGFSRTGSANQ